ncbi:hypothetical protein INR49_026473 [Caranx melampygus]|nr:hypothetical protein INR49_026473 [Caranx melampygus]
MKLYSKRSYIVPLDYIRSNTIRSVGSWSGGCIQSYLELLPGRAAAGLPLLSDPLTRLSGLWREELAFWFDFLLLQKHVEEGLNDYLSNHS